LKDPRARTIRGSRLGKGRSRLGDRGNQNLERKQKLGESNGSPWWFIGCGRGETENGSKESRITADGILHEGDNERKKPKRGKRAETFKSPTKVKKARWVAGVRGA